MTINKYNNSNLELESSDRINNNKYAMASPHYIPLDLSYQSI